jgi:hypothetical protein
MEEKGGFGQKISQLKIRTISLKMKKASSGQPPVTSHKFAQSLVELRGFEPLTP